MPFEHYDRNAYHMGEITAVGLYTNGNLTLNPLAYYRLGEPSQAHLMFDRVRRLIAIEPVLDRTLASYSFSRTCRGRNSYQVSLRAFLNFYDIDYGTTRRLHAGFDGNRLVVDLSQSLASPLDLARMQGGRFELFSQRQHGHPDDATASIYPSARIGLSKSAADQLGQPKHVELFYDQANRRIGIKAVPEATATSYRTRAVSPSCVIFCKGFLHHYKIDLSIARRHFTVMEGTTLVIDLRGASVTTTRSSKIAIHQAGQGGSLAPLRLITRAARVS